VSVIARLAGVDLSAVGAVGWSFVPGGRPHTRVMEVSQRVADELQTKQGGFVTFEIRDATRPPLVVEKLLIVDIRSGKTPFTRAVMVADKRYLWRRKTIVRDYNLRRRTGETRLSKESRIETQQPLPTVAYAPWTLHGGQPFSAGDALADVLTELDGAAPSLPAIRRSIVIENLALNDSGDVAVDRLLANTAGLGVWVDASGTTRVYDTRDGGEAAVIADAGAPYQGQGFHGRALRAYARPKRYHILIEREVEVRFDYVEADATSTSTVIRGDDAREPRSLENVIRQPDASLLLNGATVARGTLVEFNTWLAAISGTEQRTKGSAQGPLSQEYIRKRWLGNQWHFLKGQYGVRTSGADDAEWAKRLSAVRGSWRQLFRILPKWRDKLRSVKAYRVGIIDPTTGEHARTEPYMDYIERPSVAAQSGNIVRNPDVGRQVAGWAERLENGEPAPAIVTMLDEQAGLFQVALQVDPHGDADAIAPGNVDGLPTHKVTGDLAANKLSYLAWGYQPLLPTFRLAVVLSCVQGSPNNAGRYHRVTVEPLRGSATLGIDIGECLGEEATVYVPAGDLTARFMWSDDFATQIEDSFFLGTPLPDTLLTNAAQVRSVAEATAAREWATYLDREEASMSVAINPAVEIAGAIALVDHSILPGGPPTTTIMTRPEIQPPDRMSLIDPYVQRTLRHLVQP